MKKKQVLLVILGVFVMGSVYAEESVRVLLDREGEPLCRLDRWSPSISETIPESYMVEELEVCSDDDVVSAVFDLEEEIMFGGVPSPGKLFVLVSTGVGSAIGCIIGGISAINKNKDNDISEVRITLMEAGLGAVYGGLLGPLFTIGIDKLFTIAQHVKALLGGGGLGAVGGLAGGYVCEQIFAPESD